MTNTILTNANKPAPRWFRKTKRALTMLADTACVMLLAMGHQENSLIMLWCRVGLSGILQSLEVLLANGEEYVAVDKNPETSELPTHAKR